MTEDERARISMDLRWMKALMDHVKNPPSECYHCNFYAAGIGCYRESIEPKKWTDPTCPSESFLKDLMEML